MGSDYEKDLFGGHPPFEKQSATSLEAATSIRETAKSIRERIFRLIARNQGLTCDDVEALTGLRHQTASARIRELFLLGKIEIIGERKTRSGRNANVWKMKVTN